MGEIGELLQPRKIRRANLPVKPTILRKPEETPTRRTRDPNPQTKRGPEAGDAEEAGEPASSEADGDEVDVYT